KSKSKRRGLTLVTSKDEEYLVAEDPSKQGRSLIEEMDLDAGILLVPTHDEVQGRYEQNLETQEGFGNGQEVSTTAQVSTAGPEVTTADAELNTASTFVSTASPQRNVDTTADDLTLAETLMETRKSDVKDKGKAKMDETESLRKMKQRERVQISRDEEVAQKLQEEFDAAERQRMAQVHQAAQGFTDAEWDDVLARVATDEDFVQQLQAGEKCSEEDLPMKLVELVNQRKKLFAQQRAEAKRNKPMTPTQQKDYMSNYIKNQEGGYSNKQLKSLSFEQVKEIFETTIRRVQSFVLMGFELEVQRLKRAGQEVLEEPVRYPIIDCEVYSEDTRRNLIEMTWLSFEIWLRRVNGHDIFMLVEKEHLLTRGTLGLMMVARLLVEADSEMSRELLRKIFYQENIPRQGGLLGIRGFYNLMLLVQFCDAAED
ncbi:hypothetical protein Tco_0915209, partial [Tanacetum coccineum]